MAAEAKRIEAALPRGMRRVAFDERGSRVTTHALADRLVAWQGEGRDVALVVGGPDGLDAALKASCDEKPAPVGPDLAARLRARAAGRGALSRLVADREPSVPPRMKPVSGQASSTWPRRARAGAQLLAQIGVRHELLLAGADEDAEALEAERAGELPAAYVERVTRAKLDGGARAAWRRRGLPPAPILCADTTVALGRRILGKPEDAADAARMLGAALPAARIAS